MTKSMALASAVWVANTAVICADVRAQDNPGPRYSHSSADPHALFRSTLQREGSAIVDARARLERDAARGQWKLVLIADGNSSASDAPELWLMPCMRLAEMQRLVQATPQRTMGTVEFLVTGRVFVFQGRNYVLVTHAPVVTEPIESTPQREPTADASEAPSPVEAGASANASAADIIRNLERTTGPSTRSTTAAPAGNAPSARPVPTAAAVRPEGAGTSSRREKLLPEETSIVNRRGKIVRDMAIAADGSSSAASGGSFGGWMFIFDADANGLADPPLRLLPCLLLEKIEEYARRHGHNSPILISGTVYAYQGHNYLLPTVYRIPNERRNLSP